MGSVEEPFSISHIAGRYLLFDIDAISHARRAHNVCGVLIGTLPNLSQQNVFLGLPLELMPEEARVLVEQGHAYLVDDAEAHRNGFLEMSRQDRLAFLQHMDQRGLEVALATKKKLEERSVEALKKKGLAPPASHPSTSADLSHALESSPEGAAVENDDALFTPATPAPQVMAAPKSKLDPHYITPATSHPPLAPAPVDSGLPLPDVPRSYPLFRYMHSKGYFSTPGLRFGCQYTIYPGDPLRFHSHFLATGLDWDEDFDLLDIVGGGRLGTGVKKSYLLGGEDPAVKTGAIGDAADAEPVRAFSLEWAGM
jgi:tRNA-splicing endonuclease subunit Sen34